MNEFLEYLREPRLGLLEIIILLLGLAFISEEPLRTLILASFVSLLIITTLAAYGSEKRQQKLLDRKWKRWVDADQKIEAIREYRAIYGTGLKESKEAVEAYQEQEKERRRKEK